MAAAALLLRAVVLRGGRLRGFATAWCAGVAMLWIVAFALLLPWIDAARSYRGVFTDLGAHLAGTDCLVTSNLGESELSMLEYVTGRQPTRRNLGHSGSGDPDRHDPAAEKCDWRLVLYNRASEPLPEGRRWVAVWRGSRPGDRHERFVLYHRLPAGEAAYRSGTAVP